MSELFEFLEELVAVLVVYLPEFLPLGALDLLVSVLPKPVPQLLFEVVVGGVELFPVC